MRTLQLYSAPGCHLCELAKEQVEMCLDHGNLQLLEINITGDADLMRLYGTKIPVLTILNDSEKLFWPFDRLDVERFLASAV